MKKNLFLLLLVSAVTMTSCKTKYPNLDNGLYAEIVTNQGTFVAKLYHEATPLTVANFVELAEGTHEMVDSAFQGKPFYSNLTFHRVMEGFMIQGGDPEGTGSGSPGYRFPDEFVDSLKHDRKGILSMANYGPGGTNGSQFFVTLAETPWLNNRHSVFGEIVVGQEVVDSIGSLPVGTGDKPVDDVVIEMVNIINKGVIVPSFSTEMERIEKANQELALHLAKVAQTTADEYSALKTESETLESGLQVFWKHKGKGAKPADGSKIKMNYAGYLTNGKLFDTSRLEVAEKYNMVDQKRLAEGRYGPTVSDYGKEARLIPGFREGLNLMSIGDNTILFVPSHLAYGEQGIRGLIPPNSDLIFELELVEIFEQQ